MMGKRTTKDSTKSEDGHPSHPRTHTCDTCQRESVELRCAECVEEMMEKTYLDGFHDGQNNSVSG